MTRSLIALAVIAALATPAIAEAQSKGGKPAAPTKKLYRWVDKDGKVQFSDSLPPEAIDQARQEFSAKSGTATGSVDRALTAEERAALEAAASNAAAQAAREEEQRRIENAMLASYDTEADLTRAFNERVDLLKRTVEGIEVSIAGQRTSLLSQLANAAESELANRPVDAKRAQTIRDLHAELVTQQDLLMRREAELGALSQEYERTLARYRELREGAAKKDGADTAPSVEPALPPTSSGGGAL